MLSKREDTLSNSSLAQGGVAAVLDFENDSFDLHYEDTLIAGGHKTRLRAWMYSFMRGRTMCAGLWSLA